MSDMDQTPATGQPMHFKDRWLFVLLAWSAIPTAAVVAGIVAVFQGYPHWGGSLAIFGLLAMTFVTLHLLEKKPNAPRNPGPIVVGVAIVTWWLLGSLLLVQLITTSGRFPSADEIATAVVKLLPKQPADNAAIQTGRDRIASSLASTTDELNKTRQQLAALPKPSPTSAFINPFHDDLVKWKIVEGIRASIGQGSLSPDCRVIILRLQESYPEDFSAELMRMLPIIGWKYTERFATSTVPKDVTVRTIDYRQTPELRSQPAPGMECARALSARVENDARTRRGNQLNAVLHWVTNDEAPGQRSASSLSQALPKLKAWHRICRG